MVPGMIHNSIYYDIIMLNHNLAVALNHTTNQSTNQPLRRGRPPTDGRRSILSVGYFFHWHEAVEVQTTPLALTRPPHPILAHLPERRFPDIFHTGRPEVG